MHIYLPVDCRIKIISERLSLLLQQLNLHIFHVAPFHEFLSSVFHADFLTSIRTLFVLYTRRPSQKLLSPRHKDKIAIFNQTTYQNCV